LRLKKAVTGRVVRLAPLRQRRDAPAYPTGRRVRARPKQTRPVAVRVMRFGVADCCCRGPELEASPAFAKATSRGAASGSDQLSSIDNDFRLFDRGDIDQPAFVDRSALALFAGLFHGGEDLAGFGHLFV
jgi:hypothetical protein